MPQFVISLMCIWSFWSLGNISSCALLLMSENCLDKYGTLKKTNKQTNKQTKRGIKELSFSDIYKLTLLIF